MQYICDSNWCKRVGKTARVRLSREQFNFLDAPWHLEEINGHGTCIDPDVPCQINLQAGQGELVVYMPGESIAPHRHFLLASFGKLTKRFGVKQMMVVVLAFVHAGYVAYVAYSFASSIAIPADCSYCYPSTSVRRRNNVRGGVPRCRLIG